MTNNHVLLRSYEAAGMDSMCHRSEGHVSTWGPPWCNLRGCNRCAADPRSGNQVSGSLRAGRQSYNDTMWFLFYPQALFAQASYYFSLEQEREKVRERQRKTGNNFGLVNACLLEPRLASNSLVPNFQYSFVIGR